MEMKTTSNSDKISLGRGDGMEILRAIKNAKKSVKVVSPYLSPSYIKELINLRKKDIPITLITCDEIETNNYSNLTHSDIIKQKKILIPEDKRKKKTLKTTSIILFLIGFITLLFSISFLPIIFISGTLIIISIIMAIISYFKEEYKYNYHSIFRLKVFDSHSGDKPWSTNLIHSKIFLIDDKICYLGSANFTYSGFKTHYETIIKVEDPKAIQDISKEVERLFYSTELEAKDIQEWGKEIYE